MYYPKSQIKENLYTNGSEYIRIDNREAYKGFYWTNSKGGIFSGKTPQDLPSIALIRLDNEDDETPSLPQKSAAWTESYPSSLTSKAPGLSPNVYYPNPTEEDYKLTQFTRYFTKKTNQNIYYEISKKDFDKLNKKDDSIQWQLYQSISLPWSISGDKEQVEKTNKKIVAQTSH